MAPITASLDDIKVSNVAVNVPSLGKADGLCFDGKTCQFIGIPYAVVPGRFRRPQPAPAPWPGKRFNATQFGPYCPQPPRDFYPIPTPPTRPWAPKPPPTSSTECLNLNISVPFPPESNQVGNGLPVMIFLHGGAFTYAAGSAAMYDGRALADISRDDVGSPTIIITINYRLGVLGFLASKEIREYNASFGEEGVGNYGIWDQVEALRWIKQHIGAFGGDPERITLFGQSAGGVSTNIHLLRKEPLFSSAILQSGLLPLCGVMQENEHQVTFDKMLEVLQIPLDLPSHDRVQRLLEVPEDDLIAAMVPVFMTPVITVSLCDDGVLIDSPMPSWSSFDAIKAPSWCSRIMLGDAANECIIWNKAYRHHDGASVSALAETFFPNNKSDAEEILRLYNIDKSTSGAEAFDKIEKLTTDAMYLSPNYDFMKANPTCYAYHFDEKSPYDNEWGGLAHHSLENIFIWNVLRHTLPPEQQKQADRIAGMWIRFAGGHEPWQAFGPDQNMMVFSGGEAALRTPTTDASRGYSSWSRVRELGGSSLVEAWGEFAFQLCIMKREILDRKVVPKAMEVGPIQVDIGQSREPGVM